MKAKVSWVGGMRFVGSADSGHALVMESKGDDGTQMGSSPMELVLMALGGCASIDVVDILRKKRVGMASAEVALQAERAKEPPRVFTAVDMEFVLSGEGLTDAAAKRAVDLTVDKYCSVMAMLVRGGVAVKCKYRIVAPGAAKKPAAPDHATA